MTFLGVISASFLDELEKIAKTNVLRALKNPATRRQMLGWISKSQPEAAAHMMKSHMATTAKAGGGPGLTHMPAEVITKRFREASKLKAGPPATLQERLAQGVPHRLVGAKASETAKRPVQFKTVSVGLKPGPKQVFKSHGAKKLKYEGLVPLPRAA